MPILDDKCATHPPPNSEHSPFPAWWYHWVDRLLLGAYSKWHASSTLDRGTERTTGRTDTTNRKGVAGPCLKGNCGFWFKQSIESQPIEILKRNIESRKGSRKKSRDGSLREKPDTKKKAAFLSCNKTKNLNPFLMRDRWVWLTLKAAWGNW